MSSLQQAAHTALIDCMALQKNERILIVYTQPQKEIAQALYDEGKKHSEEVAMLHIPIPERSGTEPSEDVARDMQKYDVVLLVTEKSLSHTKARRDACEAGARVASLPGITNDMFIRNGETDYKVVEERTKKLVKAETIGNKIKIITKAGTHISLSIKGKIPRGGVLIKEKGEFHNLPSGEVDLAPVEGSTNGTLIIDASMAGLSESKLETPITITIENGYATKIEGDKEAEELLDILTKVNHKDAFAVAELGIGTNDKAKISGNVLEDEKVYGTAHMAFGNNKSYGGSFDVPIHLDGVFKKPTIFIDDKKIMDEGILLL